VLKLLDGLAEDGLLKRAAISNEEPASRIIDLGTGNGHMLFSLRGTEADDEDECWQGEMLGVDYSLTSVQLARQLAAQRDVYPEVRFEHWDMLDSPPGAWLGDGFDVVLDKGTFDAISLMPQTEGEQHSCETYRRKVEPLVKPGGLLVLTSCNWTKDELLSWLTPVDREHALEFHAEATYPTFTFGGQTGQSIVTVAFRKKIV
jgi:SAM-dependent methyltransferase